jgi:glyoxylase-like metal-dependent hydrolase (beta-lactamase superfamily II)
MVRRYLGLVSAAICLAGCSSTRTTQDLARDAVEAMGGEKVRSIQSYVMRGGAGSRTRLGQHVRAGGPDPSAKLADVVETFDLAGGRAALDYKIQTASGFSQHRQEVLTKRGDRLVGLENVEPRPVGVMAPAGLFSWGTQNSPSMALRRNVVRLALAAAAAQGTAAAEDKALDGKMQKFGTATIDGERIGFYFDPESKLISGFEATDTETMLGDLAAQYVVEDYRDVGGVKLPHRITIRKGGEAYADVQFGGGAVNDADALRVFDIPEAASAEVDRVLTLGPDYSPVSVMKVADGLHFVQAYSHNSLVVEFPTFLTVVEAPYTEAQSKTLGQTLAMQFPSKPIKYAAVTHPHFDHAGGVRGMAALGATILVAKGHDAAIGSLLEAPHTNPADALASRRAAGQPVGSLQAYDQKHVITEGSQSLELHAVTGSPHVEPMVLAYVPTSRVLFQSDLFFPGFPATRTPENAHLLQSVRALKLRVDKNAGGHGGVNDFAELVKVVGTAGTN